jgi:hypothetical protein
MRDSENSISIPKVCIYCVQNDFGKTLLEQKFLENYDQQEFEFLVKYNQLKSEYDKILINNVYLDYEKP